MTGDKVPNRWSKIIGIAAAILAGLALVLAGFARLTALCPRAEPAHTWCQFQANSEAIDILGILLVPAAGLLLLALIVQMVERR
jgi:hypothetical protein